MPCRMLLGIVAFSCLTTVTAKGATTVGVINIASASEKYKKTGDLESQFDALRKRLGAERDALKDKIDKANRSLQEELKPGTEEFRQRVKDIAIMEAELKWFIESESQKVERGLAESLRGIFTDIHAVVREVAEEKGIDVVLAADNLPTDAPDSPNQVRQHILLQKVLYWKPGVDITDVVIERLNARYKAAGAAAPITIESPVIKPKDAPPKKP